MTSNTNLTIYYDYTCPFAYRAVRLISEIEQTRPTVAVTWRFFSLEQINAPGRGLGENWKLWEQPLDYTSTRRSRRARSLASFLVTHAAQGQHSPAQVAQFRLAVYDAFHNKHADISDPEVLFDLAARCGLNVDDLRANWLLDAARERLRTDIENGFEAGAFGVPTLVINGCEATYLRLSAYPIEAAERETLFDELVHMLTQRPYLQELKRAGAAQKSLKK